MTIDFDIGDIVKICKRDILLGNISWPESYDQFIDKIGLVTDSDDSGNYAVDGLDCFYTHIFYKDCLQLVEKRNW
jgi:hypothetical protein